jgi:hypothetical protein
MPITNPTAIHRTATRGRMIDSCGGSGVSRSRMGVGLSRGPSSAVTVRSLALASG